MKSIAQVNKAWFLNLLFLSHNAFPVITLRTLPNSSVRVQIAWNDVREFAIVEGQPNDFKPYSHRNTVAFDDVTISNLPGKEKPFALSVPANKTLFLALAGYCGNQRVSCQKQIVLPVQDGANLLLEDQGQGDIAVLFLPVIKLVNKTNSLLRIVLYSNNVLVDHWQRKKPEQQVIYLAPETSTPEYKTLIRTIDLLPLYKHVLFAAKFIFSTHNNPLLFSANECPSLHNKHFEVRKDSLYPLNGQQSTITFQNTPEHKATTAGILCFLDKAKMA